MVGGHIEKMGGKRKHRHHHKKVHRKIKVKSHVRKFPRYHRRKGYGRKCGGMAQAFGGSVFSPGPLV